MVSVRFGWLIGIVGLLLVVAACGGAEAQTPATSAAQEAAAQEATTSTTPATTLAATTTEAPTTTAAPTTTEAPTTTAPPTTTTQPIAELPTVESAVGGTPSGDGWLREPGTYTSERLAMPLRLELTEPVAVFDVKFAGALLARPGVEFAQLDAIFFLAPVGIIPADAVGVHPPHDPVVPANTEDLPASLAAWFEAAPQITVLATDAGDGWLSWDVTVDTTAGATFPCDFGNCVAFVVDSSIGAFVIGDVFHFRIWEFDGGGDGAYALMQSDPETIDDTNALAEMVMAGLSFDG